MRIALFTTQLLGAAGVLLMVGSREPERASPSDTSMAHGGLAAAPTAASFTIVPGRVPVGIQGSSSRPLPPPRVGGRPGAAHEFYFTRGIYSGAGRGYYRGASWSIDYPKADLQFLIGLRRLTNIDAYESDNAVALDDPQLRRYPFLYILEVGYMALTDSEVEGLRDYLLAGGFLVVDDFWGTREWFAFESEMRRVFADRPIIDVPLDHPVFSVFYNITDLIQVPNVGQGHWAPHGGPTHEKDGYVPGARGILDDNGRLMVFINWNTDLGDAWEWADDPYYPLKFSTFAYEMGVNFIIYAMSH